MKKSWGIVLIIGFAILVALLGINSYMTDRIDRGFAITSGMLTDGTLILKAGDETGSMTFYWDKAGLKKVKMWEQYHEPVLFEPNHPDWPYFEKKFVETKQMYYEQFSK